MLNVANCVPRILLQTAYAIWEQDVKVNIKPSNKT